HARPFEQSSPHRRSGVDRRDQQPLLESPPIIENDRIPTNRKGYLGPSATGIDANRSPRFIRIRRSAIRLLYLEQFHASLLCALARDALNVKGLAAAATALLVRIVESEAALQLLFDVVHLGPEDEHDRLRIDQYRHPLVFDDFVEFTLLVGIFDRVAEPRAAAGPHADPHADRRLAAFGEQRLYALRCSVRHRQDLLSRQHPIFSKGGFLPSARAEMSIPYMGAPPSPSISVLALSSVAAAASASTAKSISADVVKRPRPTRIPLFASASESPRARNT